MARAGRPNCAATAARSAALTSAAASRPGRLGHRLSCRPPGPNATGCRTRAGPTPAPRRFPEPARSRPEPAGGSRRSRSPPASPCAAVRVPASSRRPGPSSAGSAPARTAPGAGRRRPAARIWPSWRCWTHQARSCGVSSRARTTNTPASTVTGRPSPNRRAPAVTGAAGAGPGRAEVAGRPRTALRATAGLARPREPRPAGARGAAGRRGAIGLVRPQRARG